MKIDSLKEMMRINLHFFKDHRSQMYFYFLSFAIVFSISQRMVVCTAKEVDNRCERANLITLVQFLRQKTKVNT